MQKHEDRSTFVRRFIAKSKAQLSRLKLFLNYLCDFNKSCIYAISTRMIFVKILLRQDFSFLYFVSILFSIKSFLPAFLQINPLTTYELKFAMVIISFTLQAFPKFSSRILRL